MSLTHHRSAVTNNFARLLRVSSKHPCPVCRHASWCSYWEDGRGAVCMRRESGKPAKGGQGWLHFFDAPAAPLRPPHARPQPQPAIERADVGRRHAVYTALLEALTLSAGHEAELVRRGLPREALGRLQYKSAPEETPAAAAAHALALKYDLRGVPGFYQAGDGWRMVRASPGFFVPYRDERGRIEGLQLRRFPHDAKDKYIWLSSKDRAAGASSGAPVHFARAGQLAGAEEVVITEGALKADVAAYLSGSPVIAAAGVSNFGENFAERLKTSFPHLRRAVIAFDRDLAHNAQVYRALLHLTGQLERARFQVRVRRWPPPSKGYDDYLLACVTSGRDHQ